MWKLDERCRSNWPTAHDDECLDTDTSWLVQHIRHWIGWCTDVAQRQRSSVTAGDHRFSMSTMAHQCTDCDDDTTFPKGRLLESESDKGHLQWRP